jgi:hypothetical protein
VVAPSPALPGEEGLAHLVSVAAAGPDDVWAVGRRFEGGRSVPHPIIEHWDGSSWTIIDGADLGEASASLAAVAALGPDDVWAAGEMEGYDAGHEAPLIEHWDGVDWSVLPTPRLGGEEPAGIPRSIDAMTVVSANDIWVLGHYQPLPDGATASVSRDVFLHWDGGSWTAVPSPQDETTTGTSAMQDLSAVSGSEAWAVGGRVDGFAEAGTAGGALVERWDGRAWSRTTAPAGDVPLTHVAAGSSNDVWAVRGGAFTSHGTHLFGPPEVLRWDGERWTTSLTLPDEEGTGIDDLAIVASNDVWAAGMAGGLPLIEHWDGSEWLAVEGADLNEESFAWRTSVTTAGDGTVVVLASNLAPSAPEVNLLWFRCGA